MSATGRGAKAARCLTSRDFETPKWASVIAGRILCSERCPTGILVDAGCGTGAIGPVVGAITQRACVGVEIDSARADKAESRGFFRSVYHADFLEWAPAYGETVGAVVANPPYGKAREFVDAARSLTDGPVCMLLRIGFLAGQKRRDWWQRNPADVYVLSKRPSFTGAGTDATDYAWYVWGQGPRGRVSVL